MKSNRTALRPSTILCFASCLSLVVGCAAGNDGGGEAGSSGGGGNHASTGGTTGAGGSTTGGGAGGSTTSAGGTTGNAGGSNGSAGGSNGSAGGSNGSAGGSSGTGGRVGLGGSTGAGGIVGTGGSTGAGGKTGPCDVWISPNGSDTNPGTQAAPMATLAAAYNVLCPGVGGAQPGDLCSGTNTTLCLMAGTYPMSARFQTKKERMGTPTRIITFMPDPAATTKPVLDFASQPRVTSCPSGTVASAPISGTDQTNHGGIDLISDYYKMQGLEIKNSNGWGMSIQGAHDVVQDLDVHNNGDCGISIRSGSGIATSGSNNTVLNCDSHQNNDVACDGANADGLCVKEGQGTGNVFDGCRSWDNSDDGIDLFAWPDPITVRNSWMFGMGADDRRKRKQRQRLQDGRQQGLGQAHHVERLRVR